MKTNKALFKSINSILIGLLGTLGFSSCFIPREEYGCPHADYTVKGTVKDNVSGNPIPGIRVAYSPLEWDENVFGDPSNNSGRNHAFVISSINGEFKLSDGLFPSQNKLAVFVEDIDAEENGLFQSKMYIISFEGIKPVGGDNKWYDGEYIVTTTISLMPAVIEE